MVADSVMPATETRTGVRWWSVTVTLKAAWATGDGWRCRASPCPAHMPGATGIRQVGPRACGLLVRRLGRRPGGAPRAARGGRLHGGRRQRGGWLRAGGRGCDGRAGAQDGGRLRPLPVHWGCGAAGGGLVRAGCLLGCAAPDPPAGGVAVRGGRAELRQR